MGLKNIKWKQKYLSTNLDEWINAKYYDGLERIKYYLGGVYYLVSAKQKRLKRTAFDENNASSVNKNYCKKCDIGQFG